MSVATGYAITIEGKTDVRTVSPNRRGAIVNWLVVTAGITARSDWSDAEIEGVWNQVRGKFPGVQCQTVTIITTGLSTATGDVKS